MNGFFSRRGEPRFPVVGIGLLYSPVSGGALDNLAQVLMQATAVDMSLSGLAFDVVEAPEEGALLSILVEGADGQPTERLIARVRWRRKLDGGGFRIGTYIESSEFLGVEESIDLGLHIQQGNILPSGLEVLCPACGERADFSLLGIQELKRVHGKCMLPLYNCGKCGTTRSIPGLLAHGRSVAGRQE